ncbi:dephospho-CoA kinase [Curvibacter sp. CHRR-16]|uniref:dephospho-CoA kinase n=1 Tax=Curvibacter sp. CHRR-16 TaxID=2835872 RepID=UPI001BD98E8D|nr:dephospho-CoA kinase [Curvibacter sp. CHRR-16]MBT0569396.1 dephospho-CoA kinase [Curvibacter sp. CHRR-16]
MLQQGWCIGLTGGIGSGKSTAGRFFAECGGTVIEADAISHQLTAAGGAAIAAIRKQLGDSFVLPDGSLDRQRTREHIFQTPHAKQTLEHILHPLIRHAMLENASAAQEQGQRLIVMDIPLLAESPQWKPLLDCICVVDCDESTQIKRVMQRNGLTSDQVQQIMHNQASRSERLACADMVLRNDTQDLMNLRQQVTSVCQQLGL